MRKVGCAAVLIIIFCLSMMVRLYAIHKSPENNQHIDLKIYRNSGQLIVNGINPYKYSDGYQVRQQLRAYQDTCNPWVCETQDRWNYYAGSNLPLTVLVLGAIEKSWHIAHPHASGYASGLYYRYWFAVFDSMLAVMVSLYIFKLWGNIPPWRRFLAALGLGALNPILLYQGSLIPEEKGLQVLFMVAALFFARSQNVFCRLVLAGIFTGASVAYKGIGIFILPLVFYYSVWGKSGAKINISTISNDKNRSAVIFTVSVLSVMLLTCLPFISGLMQMMIHRLSGDLAVASVQHASIWRYFAYILPGNWVVIRALVMAGYLSAFVWLQFVKKINVEDGYVAIVLLFTNVMLLGGSLDRMNIGILFCLVILGNKYAYRECYYYFVIAGFMILSCHLAVPFGGSFRMFDLIPGVTFIDEEYRNCLFALGFTGLHALGLFRSCRSGNAFPKQAVRADATTS